MQITRIVITGFIAALASSCATHSSRMPASLDLTGAYLGEGQYTKRPFLGGGLKHPAVRLYLHRNPDEVDSYYAVLLEYDHLENMAAPYLSTQKAPPLNYLVGYLNTIAKSIAAFKVVPGANANAYEMHALKVVDGKVQPDADASLVLTLSDKRQNDEGLLAGARITGGTEGPIFFPSKSDKKGFLSKVGDAVTVSQYELAAFTYKAAHLKSTWRGDWENISGSYLSEYGLLHDGVLELYNEGGQNKMKFVKSPTTKAKNFTNPKSAPLEGDYLASEPVKEMFVLAPASGSSSTSSATPSDRELTGRIGLFLDIFDASAPEAGSHLVVELAFINPENPRDFLMYYEHPEHAKNVGVKAKQ